MCPYDKRGAIASIGFRTSPPLYGVKLKHKRGIYFCSLTAQTPCIKRATRQHRPAWAHRATPSLSPSSRQQHASTHLKTLKDSRVFWPINCNVLDPLRQACEGRHIHTHRVSVVMSPLSKHNTTPRKLAPQTSRGLRGVVLADREETTAPQHAHDDHRAVIIDWYFKDIPTTIIENMPYSSNIENISYSSTIIENMATICSNNERTHENLDSSSENRGHKTFFTEAYKAWQWCHTTKQVFLEKIPSPIPSKKRLLHS